MYFPFYCLYGHEVISFLFLCFLLIKPIGWLYGVLATEIGQQECLCEHILGISMRAINVDNQTVNSYWQMQVI